MVGLFVMEYMTVLGMTMVLLFIESRYAKRWTILAVYSTMAVSMAALAGLYFVSGMTAMVHGYSLVVHGPSLLLFMIFSRFRGWRLVFQMFSVILFCTLIQQGVGIFYYLSGGNIVIMVLMYVLLTTAVMVFLLRFLRPLLFQVLLEVQHGWWLMCFVIGLYYCISIYLVPGYVGLSLSSTLLKPAISLLMVSFYSVLLFLFSSILKEADARHNVQMAALQLSALQHRMEATKAAEHAIRTERHDLRHRLQVAAELVARGDQEETLNFLEATQKRLDAHKTIHWCRPPVLDAVFASYFDQAQRQDIRVEAALSLPDTLPVDEGALAIVLANALENAIQANLTLPHERRAIRCKMVGAPSLMLEMSNPCSGKVIFDAQGLPVAQKEGHGLGVRSIVAFCQENGAVCQFEYVDDGWFRLRVVL